jgi:hypothetical protein
MGDYNRSTRELTLDALPPSMSAALMAHIEKYNLGEVLSDVLFCAEANAEKIKKGLFAGPGPKVLKTGLVLTKRWLFEVQVADGAAPYARSIRLVDGVVEDYEKSSFQKLIPDTGVNLTGQFTDTTERASSFIGLGRDAAGEKFKQLLIQAVQAAKS